ncbi:MAG: ribonuclease HII [Candidatus Bathyarchaeota archaeon]|nr:ribonuclease HII [Candidatus Bathyarchaeota archaeon]
MLMCGVDDAGRGAVLGPLVIAGVLVCEEDLKKIVSLGVKDSKLISPPKRRRLAPEIVKIVKNHHIVRLAPAEIDEVVENGGKLHRLNRLEARAMAEVIRKLKPDVAYVDASDVLPERFKQHIAEEVPFDVQIVSEHKADKTYPVVSAASIIAKVERDEAIANLRSKYGDLGSGYISDRKTVGFLENWIRTHGSYPEFVRKSWKPAKRIEASHNTFQKRLL